jgi:hypothetical protein
MIDHFSKTVTTHGTAVPLSATEQRCAFVTIWPLATNIGQVRVGGPPHTGDSNGIPAGKGMPLNAGDSGVTWPIMATNGYNLKDIYLDSDNDTDGVQGIYGAP